MNGFRTACCWLAGSIFVLSSPVSAQQAEEYDDEIKQYQELVAQNPNNLDFAYTLGTLLAWAGRFDDAIATYEALLQKEPKYIDAELGIARSYGWKGEQQTASEKFREIIAKDPSNFEAYQGLGSLALWVNNFAESIRYYREALLINPNDIVSLKGIGRAYLGRGDRRRAEEYFTRVQILEIRQTPIPLVLGIAGGVLALFVAGLLWARSRARRRKKKQLKIELKMLRYALALYHQVTGKFPVLVEKLLEEKLFFDGLNEERPFLEGIRRAERGFVVDPFGGRYWYNHDTGGIYSTTKGCEEW